MIDIERGDFESARNRSAILVELGEKLPIGSEGPFARAMAAVCEYALEDETDSLNAAFDQLRGVDAKHRLAYALTRAALIDIERERFDRAIARAGEALECAQLLDRATDVMLAHLVLAQAYRAQSNEQTYAEHAAAIAESESSRVAVWVRDKAADLLSAKL